MVITLHLKYNIIEILIKVIGGRWNFRMDNIYFGFITVSMVILFCTKQIRGGHFDCTPVYLGIMMGGDELLMLSSVSATFQPYHDYHNYLDAVGLVVTCQKS